MNLNTMRLNAYLKNTKESQASEDHKITGNGLQKITSESLKEPITRRVAKFLILIGKEEASKVLPLLGKAEQEKILREITTIKNIPDSEATSIYREFSALLEKVKASGGKDTAYEILSKAYGKDKAEVLFNEINKEEPFSFLKGRDSESVKLLISEESDAVITLVLTHLEPKIAAEVLSTYNIEEKKRIVTRLAHMEKISPEVLHMVSEKLKQKSTLTESKSEGLDGKASLTEILKRMSLEQENDILASIGKEDPSLRDELQQRLFTIEDVLNSDDRFIQERLRAMSDVDIVYLIADKKMDFREKILSCVSDNRRSAILSEEEIRKPILKRECQRVTGEFFSYLRSSFENGSLVIIGRNENLVC